MDLSCYEKQECQEANVCSLALWNGDLLLSELCSGKSQFLVSPSPVDGLLTGLPFCTVDCLLC